jgi:DNA repair exonuclease SbcCD ATPase subunit/predicted phosphodiesterase
MRFAHIADTHIRNLKYHYEYREVFDQLYDLLKEKKVDYIVHCGDIAHTKTQISPEFVGMCRDFFKNLADIAPTYVILGNHDGNLKNSSRLDALTPIAKALDHPNLHLLKNSGETKIDDKFVLNVLSVFDADNWTDPTSEDDINIALYHGSVSGCKTDSGWTMQYGEHDVAIFDKFDYAFLGDIHKTNQVLDEEGRIRYCGSTIQQNHGESDDKGLLIWDIENKEKFSVEHFSFQNPKPFVTIVLTPKGRIPKATAPPTGARLRLVSNNNLPLDVVRKAVDVAKARFKPEAITFLNRNAGDRGSVEELAKTLQKENLRDITVQESLITEYLKDYQADEETLERVFELNRKYNTLAEENEEVARNVNWKLKTFKWDNLFNYGTGNEINFAALNGVVGIFGKNFSGKSSIVDSMLYTVYNSTSKNNRKNLNIINQNTEFGKGTVEIDIGHDTYTVSRESTKYEKKLKGEVTLEAKTDANFEKVNNATQMVQSLNGLTRNETDKNIRKLFGTLDDFLITSMSSQMGALSFIGEGSTRRKEILAKFLDLEIFERKFRMAKEDASDTKGAISRLQDRDFDEEIKEARTNLAKNEILTDRKKKECQVLKDKIAEAENMLGEIKSRISSIPADIIDISKINKDLDDRNNKVDILQSDNLGYKAELEEKEELVKKIKGFLEDFDIEEIYGKNEAIEENLQKIDNLANDIGRHEDKLNVSKRKVKLLKEVPCGSEFSHCKFIKDAYTALDNVNKIEKSLDELSINKNRLTEENSALNPDKTKEYIEKYDKLLKKQSEIGNEMNTLQLDVARNNSAIVAFEHEIKDLFEQKGVYEENKEAIENLEGLMQRQRLLEGECNKCEKKHDKCQETIMELYKVHGSLEQRVNDLETTQQEFMDLQNDYAAYDLYMRCMHANGISYDIIKKRLPFINAEVAKVLANVVDFEVFFENDGKKLDINIKHPKHDPRPIEMGSGAEKTISAMAIRLALLNVSTLPKSDIFVLDEPGTALDEENMEGFIRILELIKTQFKTVLLISHLDSLKDTVDTQIVIEQKKGYAYVKQ